MDADLLSDRTSAEAGGGLCPSDADFRQVLDLLLPPSTSPTLRLITIQRGCRRAVGIILRSAEANGAASGSCIGRRQPLRTIMPMRWRAESVIRTWKWSQNARGIRVVYSLPTPLYDESAS